MQFINLALIGLVGLCSAAPAYTPDLNQISQDLALISGSLDGVSGAALAYTGGLWDGIGLITAVSILEGQVSDAAADIEDHGALSLADSTTVINAVAAISNKYVKALGDLQAKSSQIAGANYKLLFHSSILRIRDNTNFLSNSLHKEVDSSLNDKVTSLLKPVFAAFDAAAAAI